MGNGTKPAKVQLPYHVVNLHPSVPSDRSIQSIVEFLQEDHEESKKRTKLNLTDIHQLLGNLGPIGLSIMVII